MSIALPPPSAGLATAILGFWQLVSREDFDAAGQRNIDPVLGADPLGVLCFAPGRFAAQFSRRDRSGAAAAPPNSVAPGANNSTAVNGYDAYFGTYTLNEGEGLVTVTLDAALSPAGMGQSYTRRVRVAAGVLFIQLDTTAADGVPITRTLRFARVV